MRNVEMNRQRGVALLLSLGVLSLLLVSGIAFVAGALHSQRAAAAYRFRTQAQLLGKSSVNRVMMLMRYYLQQGDAEGIGELKSSLNSGAFADEAKAAEDVMTAEKSVSMKWEFEIPPAPIPDDQIAEVIEDEIIVVGSGMSGLTTAYSAQSNVQQGLRRERDQTV